MLRRLVAAAVLALSSVVLSVPANAEEKAICYNCPPEWADWASQLKLIGSKLGITVPPDNKNSGQSIAAMIAEKASPVTDVVYLGGIAAEDRKSVV